MATHKVDFLEIKTNKNSAKLVNPSESTFTDKAVFVDRRVEQAFAAAFGRFPVALVFGDVGNELVIEADFAGVTGVKGTVGIEVCSGNGDP